MNKRIIIAVLIALAIGLGGGAIGTYSWLHTSNAPTGQAGRDDPNQADDHDTDEGSHDNHGGLDEHAEHAEDVEGIRISEEVMEEFGVRIAVAGSGELESHLLLPGEVVVNPDKVAHVVPRVPGIAEEITKTIGDAVETGESLAVIESAQLANAKAAFLAAKQRLSVARAIIAANEKLKTEGIVSELDYLAARRELAEAEIQQRAAEFELYALGLTQDALPEIKASGGASFATSVVRAPFAGMIIERHITHGEVVTPESEIFVIADLSTVWVYLTVYQKDLAHVLPGQGVSISFGHDIPDAQGVIDYVSPAVDEKTRTATARVVIENPRGDWRPGLFVEARVQITKTRVPICVPTTALLTMNDQTVVFVESEDRFRLQRVKVGRSNGSHVEISAGLSPGERYVSQGTFNLKAELVKESFAAGGHSH